MVRSIDDRDSTAEKAKKESDTKLVNWGWANTIDKKKYGQRLTAAKQDPDQFEAFLQMIRDAQARRAAKDAATKAPDATAPGSSAT